MSRGFVLAPEAARDLVGIWRFVRERGSLETANRVELAILAKLSAVAQNPGIGHSREDLFSEEPLKFVTVYSYLIVYRPDTNPVQVAAILHGHRNVEAILRQRA
ncbi:MAG: type II toxin-antitoxin system RelE/ParE family toxin [Acidobacteriota bacterium]